MDLISQAKAKKTGRFGGENIYRHVGSIERKLLKPHENSPRSILQQHSDSPGGPKREQHFEKLLKPYYIGDVNGWTEFRYVEEVEAVKVWIPSQRFEYDEVSGFVPPTVTSDSSSVSPPNSPSTGASPSRRSRSRRDKQRQKRTMKPMRTWTVYDFEYEIVLDDDTAVDSLQSFTISYEWVASSKYMKPKTDSEGKDYFALGLWDPFEAGIK